MIAARRKVRIRALISWQLILLDGPQPILGPSALRTYGSLGPSGFIILGLKEVATAEVPGAACEPQGKRGAHWAHSGNPAFRRPSIRSFEFDCPPRAIHEEIVKVGSTSRRRP